MTAQEIAIIETYGEQDKVALAQLGAAVVLAWRFLDEDLQRDLVATAAIVDGVEKDKKFDSILKRLVLSNDRSGGKQPQN
ncbi:hypothetical protein [Methylobacterium brachythecii]|nr:hypothetical protein [Methylobacterium brachythecii]MBB3904205.1 hypothetical protein [Methylobacterium brachythecii]